MISPFGLSACLLLHYFLSVFQYRLINALASVRMTIHKHGRRAHAWAEVVRGRNMPSKRLSCSPVSRKEISFSLATGPYLPPPPSRRRSWTAPLSRYEAFLLQLAWNLYGSVCVLWFPLKINLSILQSLSDKILSGFTINQVMSQDWKVKHGLTRKHLVVFNGFLKQ